MWCGAICLEECVREWEGGGGGGIKGGGVTTGGGIWVLRGSVTIREVTIAVFLCM